MPFESVGFIGGGRVVSILLGGLARFAAMPHRVVVSDPDEQVLQKLKGRHNNIEAVINDNTFAASQSLVFLAVHPPLAEDILEQIRPALRQDSILVSFVPKLPIARISQILGGFTRIARMIPNAPSIVGSGYNPVSFCPALEEEGKSVLLEIFAPLGRCPVVPEENLEAYAVITGMGPTYFWFQIYELESLAQKFGLAPEKTREAVVETLKGAISTMVDSRLTPAEVMDLIPVRPLGDAEESIIAAYRQRLTALMEKLRV